MTRMRTGSLLVALFAVGSSVAFALPAQAACSSTHMCAWKDKNYSNTLEFDSNLAAGNHNLGVLQHDTISSGKNGTGNKWCGVNELTFQPDVTVVSWTPGAVISDLSGVPGANDKIDHFDVVKAGSNCVV